MTNAVMDPPIESATALFETIATDLYQQGYCVLANAFPHHLTQSLLQHVHSFQNSDFQTAGTGRLQEHHINTKVRRDKIRWLNSNNAIENTWLSYMADLQQYLNRRLFLGLFSYESHFAHYSNGDFYKKHMDAFQGQANRILTSVLYLNPNWHESDAGELLIFNPQQHDEVLVKVKPEAGTLVIFLSEEFPHEVLPCNNHRYSIAGWFRLNSSHALRADPPR